jgi:hypothetical protein
MLAAIGLAGTLPLTPGNAGIGAAAVALALEHHGVRASTGLAAGVVYGLTETAVAVAAGIAGAGLLVSAARRSRAPHAHADRPRTGGLGAQEARQLVLVAPPGAR